jgi:hypothetical protein
MANVWLKKRTCRRGALLRADVSRHGIPRRQQEGGIGAGVSQQLRPAAVCEEQAQQVPIRLLGAAKQLHYITEF